MSARDLESHVREIVADQVRQVSFTDQIDFLVTWDEVGAPVAPNVPVLRPAVQWTVWISLKTGLLAEGQDWLHNRIHVTKTQPDEAKLRTAITELVEGLRNARTRMKAPQNGHAKLAQINP